MQAVTITQITYSELETLIERTLRNIIRENITSFNNRNTLDDVWFTRKEVAKLLGVTIATIAEWTRNAKLTGYKIGGSNRVRYKKSEILNVLKIINNQ